MNPGDVRKHVSGALYLLLERKQLIVPFHEWRCLVLINDPKDDNEEIGQERFLGGSWIVIYTVPLT